MQGVKRSIGAVSKGGVLKIVYCKPKKSGDRAGYLASGESSSAISRSDRGHPRSFKGYPSDWEERGTGSSSGGELSG